MIGRLHYLVIDCPEPEVLAAFYSALLGHPVTYRSEEFMVVAVNEHSSGLAFQRAPNHLAPRWPDPAYPAQMHLDVMVDDVESAGAFILTLEATRLGGPTSPVYADPAGHPLCLIQRPDWAEPVGPGV